MKEPSAFLKRSGSQFTCRGIKYVSLWEISGYAESARRQILGLARAGIPVTWTPMIRGTAWGLGYEPYLGKSIGDPDLDPYCNKEINYDSVVLHVIPEYFPRWLTLESDKPVFGVTTWETTELPAHWPALFHGLQALIVPSSSNHALFSSSITSVPVYTVPHIAPSLKGVSTQPPELSSLSNDSFMFYSINTWTERKAMPQLVSSYLEAFTAEDKVALVLCTDTYSQMRSANPLVRFFQNQFPPRVSTIVDTIRKKYPAPAPIYLLENNRNRSDITWLHQRGNCYISLTRGEGWGLGAFEAAANSNPVIISGFGGQRDYLSRDAAYLLDYSLTAVHYPAGRPNYTPNQRWAEVDSTAAVDTMRLVRSNHLEAATRGQRLGSYIAAHFNEDAITTKLLHCINEGNSLRVERASNG